MKQRLTSRLTAILIVLITIFSLVPIQSFALPPAPPVDAFAGAGGGGSGSGGGVGTGQWNSDFQGLRITVLDYAGEPAFTFNGKNHFDLLFTNRNIENMDYFCDGNKTSYANKKFHYRDPNAMNVKSYTLDYINNAFNSLAWDSSVPKKPGETFEQWNERCWKLKARFGTGTIPKPINAESSTYFGQGKAIRNVLYGSGEKMSEDAYLYIILNIQDAKSQIYGWQPKADAYLPGAEFTAEEKEWIRTGLKDGQKYFPTDLMASKKLAISVEPIIWNKLRLTWTASNPGADQFSYGVYGTQSSIGNCTKYLESKGWFKPSSGKGAGGADSSIFGNVGRKALTTDDSGFVFSSYKDTNGKYVSESWVMDVPTPKGAKQYVTDDEVRTSDLGWAVQIYLLDSAPVLDPSTHTWDFPIQTPQPAPDPKDIPKLPEEQVDKTRIYNIVKTYREEDADGNINHIATYSRTNNPSKIDIQDEPEFKVSEWFISKTYNNPSKETTWEDNHNQAPTTGPTGTKPSTATVVPDNTTLYVLLEKKTPELKGNLVIKESQVTKAAETLTTSADNWGPKTMTFSANDISGSCPYIWYCGGKNCGGHRCGSAYYLDDTSWDYNHVNATPIDTNIHASGGEFAPINAKGLDAIGCRGTVGTYINFVNTFNYKLVVWRGLDIPTIFPIT